MKCTDLMIGDWVYCEGQPTPENVTIQTIAEDGVWFNGSNYEGAASYDRIFPIPLTPEILEKNGFVQNPRSKSRRSHQICTDSVYISWWRGRLNILFKPFIGHSTNHVNVDGKYVHELQHALRLCGIEKEIVV